MKSDVKKMVVAAALTVVAARSTSQFVRAASLWAAVWFGYKGTISYLERTGAR